MDLSVLKSTKAAFFFSELEEPSLLFRHTQARQALPTALQILLPSRSFYSSRLGCVA